MDYCIHHKHAMIEWKIPLKCIAYNFGTKMKMYQQRIGNLELARYLCIVTDILSWYTMYWLCCYKIYLYFSTFYL